MAAQLALFFNDNAAVAPHVFRNARQVFALSNVLEQNAPDIPSQRGFNHSHIHCWDIRSIFPCLDPTLTLTPSRQLQTFIL